MPLYKFSPRNADNKKTWPGGQPLYIIRARGRLKAMQIIAQDNPALRGSTRNPSHLFTDIKYWDIEVLDPAGPEEIIVEDL